MQSYFYNGFKQIQANTQSAIATLQSKVHTKHLPSLKIDKLSLVRKNKSKEIKIPQNPVVVPELTESENAPNAILRVLLASAR